MTAKLYGENNHPKGYQKIGYEKSTKAMTLNGYESFLHELKHNFTRLYER